MQTWLNNGALKSQWDMYVKFQVFEEKLLQNYFLNLGTRSEYIGYQQFLRPNFSTITKWKEENGSKLLISLF